jgi:small GTP-binding protein
MKRFAIGKFKDKSIQSTITMESCQREVSGCQLTIHDTSGHERFKAMTASYYRKAHGAILVFDITDRRSFNEIRGWMKEVLKHAQNVPIFILVGNKCEDEALREIGRREAQDLADTYSMEYIETSAKDGTNVDIAFEKIATKTCNAVNEGHIHIQRDENVINLQGPGNLKFKEIMNELCSRCF